MRMILKGRRFIIRLHSLGSNQSLKRGLSYRFYCILRLCYSFSTRELGIVQSLLQLAIVNSELDVIAVS